MTQFLLKEGRVRDLKKTPLREQLSKWRAAFIEDILVGWRMHILQYFPNHYPWKGSFSKPAVCAGTTTFLYFPWKYKFVTWDCVKKPFYVLHFSIIVRITTCSTNNILTLIEVVEHWFPTYYIYMTNSILSAWLSKFVCETHRCIPNHKRMMVVFLYSNTANHNTLRYLNTNHTLKLISNISVRYTFNFS